MWRVPRPSQPTNISAALSRKGRRATTLLRTIKRPKTEPLISYLASHASRTVGTQQHLQRVGFLGTQTPPTGDSRNSQSTNLVGSTSFSLMRTIDVPTRIKMDPERAVVMEGYRQHAPPLSPIYDGPSLTGHDVLHTNAKSGRIPLSADPMPRRTAPSSLPLSKLADFFSAEVFQSVLRNPAIAYQMLKFSRAHFCGENLEFLEKVWPLVTSSCCLDVETEAR